MNHFLIIISFFLTCSLFAQSSDEKDVTYQMRFYSDVMVNAEASEHRKMAFDRFNLLFDELSQSDSLYAMDYSMLKWISVIEPEDKAFKLISWQVALEEGKFDFKAYLVKPDGKLFSFQRNDFDRGQIAYMALTHNEWYGCLYYNIIKTNENEYLVFGYDASGNKENRKIADVISFKDDQLLLGKEIFEDKKNLGRYNYRLILDYSIDANVNLNYNPSLKLIVHDHLIRRMGRLSGQGPVNVPDGSYEAYMYKEDKWSYKEKLFNHMYDEAPRPKPVLDNKKKGKDLFGRN